VIANMPTNSFVMYVVVFWVQFVFVMGYGIWWYLQGKKEEQAG